MSKYYISFFFTVITVASVYAQETIHYLSGRFNPAKETRFLKIPSAYASAPGQYLRKETLAAFVTMAKDLKKEGFSLYVVSSTRNFDHQKNIWSAKFTGKILVGGQDLSKTTANHLNRARKILRYSSMPGTSRHHWGTDFDLGYARKTGLSMLNNSTYEKGEGLRFYTWMLQNAHKYGFCQPYRATPQDRGKGKYQEGYQEEKWHWSYKPLSSKLLLEYEASKGKLYPSGFPGDKAAGSLFMDYVSNVHESCR